MPGANRSIILLETVELIAVPRIAFAEFSPSPQTERLRGRGDRSFVRGSRLQAIRGGVGEKSWVGMSRSPDRYDRACGVAYGSVRHTAEEDPLGAAEAARAHYDQVG